MVARRAKAVRSTPPDRFASGFSLLELRAGRQGADGRQEGSILVDLVRPEDLVALRIEAIGCELIGGEEPVLRPRAGAAEARLMVRYSFQHLAERAFYEGGNVERVDPHAPTEPRPPTTEVADARPSQPVEARAANGTRLVFDVPAGETIPFTTVGILAAMSRLTPVLHKLALPGTAPSGHSTLRDAVLSNVHLIAMPNGLVGALSATTVVARQAKTRDLRLLGAPPHSNVLATIQYNANASRRARRLLFDRTASLDQSTALPTHRAETLDILIDGRRLEIQPVVGPGGLVVPHWPRPRVRAKYSYAPAAEETAIEAPYRLIVSPGPESRWKHALEPVRAGVAIDHVELWHSRLGQLTTGLDGVETIDEKDAGRRIVRAIWTRDRDGVSPATWRARDYLETSGEFPFRMSLNPLDRHMLVRQTAETVAVRGRSIDPVPLAADALWLSGLGAWLKLHGSWDTLPYSSGGFASILFMNYIAPLGRDQHVEVAYPGYLFPFGHRATLVKVTDRKMKARSPSLAALYQRKFLVIGEPRRVYGDTRDLPFSQIEIRPLVTPALDDPGSSPTLFWPTINNQNFLFEVRALDQEAQPLKLHMPLMWVAERNMDYAGIEKAYRETDYLGQPGRRLREVPAFGQQIAFAPSKAAQVATLPTESLRFLGKAVFAGSEPRISSARVSIPAVQQLAQGPPIPIFYHPLYKSAGFHPASNKAEIWAQVLVSGEVDDADAKLDPGIAQPVLGFGKNGASTDRSGGFVAPSVPLRGLSRVMGAVGSVDGTAANLQFRPKDFFKGSAPKLFGVIPLDELPIDFESDLLRIPKIISEFVDRVEALIKDIGRAAEQVADAAAEVKRMAAEAVDKPKEWQDALADAISKADTYQNAFADFQARIGKALDMVKADGKSAAATSYIDTLKGDISQTIGQLEDLASKLPTVVGNLLRAVANLLKTSIDESIDLVEDMIKYVNGIAQDGALARVQFEWKPRVQSWPSGSPFIELQPDSLVFKIGVQAGMNGKNEAFALAQLVDFKLHLFPNAELLSLSFDRFGFKSGGGKPEVDVVFRTIGFHGVLKFVETIKDLIPLDGFSDPPYVNVKPEGLTAGFGLALPDIAMGMFSITNMSLNADVQVPFLGAAVTVGFSFCTRERPFTIAVAFLGGGGWCGIRLSADGLEVLEVGLEAGACIAVDFGVASGSVSAMLGVYIRLEGKGGSLAGYFRLRGEVDVLGLVSAAIELYMALLYHFDSGKLVGEAKISVNVSVMGLSKEVHIYAQRTFKGANADPSFRQIMVEADGSAPSWDIYCQAFAEE